jgi:hypothetical protein
VTGAQGMMNISIAEVIQAPLYPGHVDEMQCKQIKFTAGIENTNIF